MPAITGAALTTEATSSQRRIDRVSNLLCLWVYNSHTTQRGSLFRILLVSLCLCFCVTAERELLNPENDTIGVLVSMALDITIGGKTIKPAGELTWIKQIILSLHPSFASVCFCSYFMPVLISILFLIIFFFLSCWSQIRPWGLDR